MMLLHHRIVYSPAQSPNQPGCILLGSFHSVSAFRSDTGEFVSSWNVEQYAEEHTDLSPQPEASEDDEPTSKRRKILPTEDDVSEVSSAEIVVENGGKMKRRPKPKKADLPAITSLHSTRDGQHVIVTTGEDKSVRVLKLDRNGILSPFNERYGLIFFAW